KSVSGLFLQAGTPVTYMVVLTNSGTGTQQDNPGNELTDVLPSSLTLVSASATSGTTGVVVATNTGTWNGSIPAGGTVTITINATIKINVAPGTTISNQATFSYDADGDGTNEANGVSDDPRAQGGSDPTSFQVQGPDVPFDIPTLDGL